MTGRTYLSVSDILVLHTILIEKFGGEPGLLDLAALESAIARPQSGYYIDVVEEACALFQSLWTNHAFLDGNKRVAFAALSVFLQINGYRFKASSSNPFQEFLMWQEGSAEFKVLVDLLKESVEAR